MSQEYSTPCVWGSDSLWNFCESTPQYRGHLSMGYRSDLRIALIGGVGTPANAVACDCCYAHYDMVVTHFGLVVGSLAATVRRV